MISQLISRAFRARAFSLLLLFALPGCSGLVNLPGSGPAPDLYDLTPSITSCTLTAGLSGAKLDFGVRS